MDACRALYCADETRALDRCAIEQHAIAGFTLMQRAAAAAWDELRARWPQAQRITLLCGPGNNGGDGFLLALRARQAGCDAHVVALADTAHGDAATARQAWRDAGGDIQPARPGQDLPAADVYVDALFGSGFNRAAEGLAADLIERLNAADAPIFAIDVPSGLDADTGCRTGPCVVADATLCLVGWKQGIFTHDGVDCAGRRALHTLQIPAAVYQARPARAHLLAPRRLPSRAGNSHKGRFGHVLVAGGEHGFGGAVRLAGEAALRCGAGLVSVATRQLHVAPLLAACPELMVHVASEDGMAQAVLDKASVLVVGPGLGQGAWGRMLLRQALVDDRPLVLDADGLNMLVGQDDSFAGRSVILTPHPGEAARLLGCDSATVQADRFAAARTLAERFACVVVLKGAGSLVAEPGGRVAVCPWGNPGMASGGMGDVLSGVTGALLAQHLDAWQAATLAVGLHARAGDCAAREGETGLLARDLLPCLRALLDRTDG